MSEFKDPILQNQNLAALGKEVGEELSKPAVNSQSLASQPPPSLSPHRNKRILMFGLIIFLIILLGGSAVAAYYFYFRPTPEKVFAKMLDKMATVKTFSFQGDAIFSSKAQTPVSPSIIPLFFNNNFDLTMDFSGRADFSEKTNPEFSTDIKLKALFLPPDFSLNLLTVNKKLYFKLENLPDLSFLKLPDLNFLKNQWIQLDLNTYANQISQFNINQTNESLQKIEEIKELYKKNQFLVLTKAGKDREEIEGVKTFQFSFYLDSKKYKNFLQVAMPILGQTLPQPQESEKIMDELFKNLSFQGKIWIGKKDHLLYKLVVDYNLSPTTKEGNNQLILPVNFSSHLALNLANFNQPLEIKPPTSFITSQEIVDKFKKNIQPTPTISHLDSDNDGLTDYTEIYNYHTDPHNPDTDGDGYLDGAEVSNGYNPNGPGKLLINF